MQERQHNIKQPPVFYLTIFTSLWERFGYYVLSFLLVLYAKSEFGFSDTLAFILYGVFTALAYLTPAIGGYLADNVFGIRRCIILGLFLEGTGLSLLAIPNSSIFPVALAFIIVGCGLFKTGPSHLLGRSYGEKDHRIDSGFTLMYMGMNIGSFASSILTAIMHRYFGWHIAFLMGGIAVYISLLFYFFLRHSAREVDSHIGKQPLSKPTWITILVGIAIAIFAASFLVAHTTIANIVLICATILLFFYFLFEIIRSSREEKFKIVASLLLIFIGLVFFVLYQQSFTSIVLFINRSVDRQLFNITIPTEAFLGLNAFWVVILGPVLAFIYSQTRRALGKDLSITLKFSLGLLATSSCFFALVLSTFFHNSANLVAIWWVVLIFFLLTLGEMLVSALGTAMITHIAPKRMYGIMMGTWFLVGMSFSAALSGLFARIASVPENIQDPTAILHIYSNAFLKIGIVGLICTAAAFAVSPMIKRFAQLD